MHLSLLYYKFSTYDSSLIQIYIDKKKNRMLLSFQPVLD